MNISSKYKLLTSADILKVSLPILVLLGVFFIKPMIESQIEDIYKGKLSALESSLSLSVDDDDNNFIQALLDDTTIIELHPFMISDYRDSTFIMRLFNKTAVVDEPEEAEQQVEEQITLPSYVLSSVFNGKTKKYAVLNGTLAKVGDVLSNGDKIVAISDRRVLIEGTWGKQWFYVQY